MYARSAAAWLLVVGSMLSASAVGAEISRVLLAEAEADIGFDTEGRVTRVELVRTPAMEGLMGDRVQARMAAWRFQPVLDEHGEPAPARTRARLMLEATPLQDGGFSVRLGQPAFSASAVGERVRDADHAYQGQRIHRARPAWPRSASPGLSAHVVLLVEFDAEGAVVRAGARSASLLGVTVRERQERQAHDLLRPFVQEAERTLMRWRFPPAADPEAGPRQVLVPIQFSGWGEPIRFHQWEHSVSVHGLEREWAKPGRNVPSVPDMLAAEDAAAIAGGVRLVDPVEGEVL